MCPRSVPATALGEARHASEIDMARGDLEAVHDRHQSAQGEADAAEDRCLRAAARCLGRLRDMDADEVDVRDAWDRLLAATG